MISILKIVLWSVYCVLWRWQPIRSFRHFLNWWFGLCTWAQQVRQRNLSLRWVDVFPSSSPSLTQSWALLSRFGWGLEWCSITLVFGRGTLTFKCRQKLVSICFSNQISALGFFRSFTTLFPVCTGLSHIASRADSLLLSCVRLDVMIGLGAHWPDSIRILGPLFASAQNIIVE